MNFDYDLIVIGAGGGGLTAAIGGAGIGASVLLIEGEKLGGDCTHYGCIPSKALIKAANVYQAQKDGKKFGLDAYVPPKPSVKAVLTKVQDIVSDVEARFEDIEHIRSLGVDVKMGHAQFTDGHTVVVDGTNISAKKIVIATGARPVMLDIPGLSDCMPKTNRTIFDADTFTSLLVIGSGPIGCELGQAFARLGVAVTIVTRDTRILSREEQQASTLVADRFDADGITTIADHEIVRAYREEGQKCLLLKNRTTGVEQSVCADDILLAVGRQPNVEKLALEKAGVTYNTRRGITVNKKTQTNINHIYAVGDVATQWKFTHYANHMAKTTLAHALLHYPFAAIEATVIPRVTFTTPEVGSVGVTYDSLTSQQQDAYHVFNKAYENVDRAITDRDENGFMQIITDTKGAIVGATTVGHAAGEMINEIALAMKNDVSITQLADTIHAYPTYGYGLRNCADGFRAMGYTKGKRDVVKKIFGLRGK